MKKTIFQGSGVAIVTPFDKENKINYPLLGELIDWQIKEGTDAIIICGTTGESSTLTDEEHTEEIKFAVKQVAGRVPVIAGVGSNDTAYAVTLSKEAYAAGADGLLHVTPYYNKTSQRGLVAHFNAVADASPLPIILYNVPSRTGLNILPETYLELSKHPNIVATKEANDNIVSVAKTRSLCGNELDIYSGNDNQITAMLSLGGKGVISVMANIMPKLTHEICARFFDGDIAGSAALQLSVMELIEMLFMDVNPIPVKEALNMMGYGVGSCRLPLFEMADGDKQKLRNSLEKLNLI